MELFVRTKCSQWIKKLVRNRPTKRHDTIINGELLLRSKCSQWIQKLVRNRPRKRHDTINNGELLVRTKCSQWLEENNGTSTALPSQRRLVCTNFGLASVTNDLDDVRTGFTLHESSSGTTENPQGLTYILWISQVTPLWSWHPGSGVVSTPFISTQVLTYISELLARFSCLQSTAFVFGCQSSVCLGLFCISSLSLHT